MYIHYRTKGFPKPLLDHPSKARAGISTEQQFQQFKLLVRKTVERACLSEQDRDAFKPKQVTWPNLTDVGLEGKHAAVSFNICVDAQEQEHIAKKLLLLGAHHKAADVEAYINEGKKLKPRPANLRGKQKWDAKIPTASIDLDGHQQPPPITEQAGIQMHITRCPKCQKQNHADGLRFTQTDLDIKIPCRTCKKSSPSRAWKCNCEILWHTCQRHVPIPIQDKKKTIITAATTSSGHASTSLKRLLDDELKRESKRAKHQPVWEDEDVLILESPPNIGPIREGMLTDSLRDKFPSVCAASAVCLH
jgi:hypothetical protein